jgi:hypothetical protein
MAKQKNFYFRGRYGNLIFYERLGGYYIRQKPEVVKQTKASKASSGKFGRANTTAAFFRKEFRPLLPNPTDREMMYRFADALYQWLLLNGPSAITPTEAIPFVTQFQFNEDTSMGARCKLPLNIVQPPTGLLTISIPAFVPADVIVAPAGTISVNYTITAACYSLQREAALGSYTHCIPIPYNNEMMTVQVISFPFPAEEGVLLITAASLEYKLDTGNNCDKASFRPASVIDARYC